MMLKPDQERVRTLLRDTITLLCKNGLSFKTKFSIDAVIGVTLDEADAFYVSMNQVVAADKPVLEQDESNSSGDETEALYKQKRKRRGTRHKQSKQIKVEDKQTISIPEDSQHNDMVEQFDDSEGDNSEDASNLSGTFKVEIDESNKDIVFIKQEIEHGESWQETVRGSTSFQASDSNYSGLDASQDGGRNWMQGSQQANLEQSPNTSAALGTSQQLSHVQPVMNYLKKVTKSSVVRALGQCRHWLDPIPASEAVPTPRRRCCKCKLKGKRRDTRFYCQFCPDQPILCQECFLNIHGYRSSVRKTVVFIGKDNKQNQESQSEEVLQESEQEESRADTKSPEQSPDIKSKPLNKALIISPNKHSQLTRSKSSHSEFVPVRKKPAKILLVPQNQIKPAA